MDEIEQNAAVDRKVNQLRRENSVGGRDTPNRLDMAADVIIAAVEAGMHGIRYWADVVDYDWSMADMGDRAGMDSLPPGRDSDARATIREQATGKEFVLTPENVLAAMRRIVADSSWAKYGWDGELRLRVLAALHDPSVADFDADDADCIVQRVCFDKLVYG